MATYYKHRQPGSVGGSSRLIVAPSSNSRILGLDDFKREIYKLVPRFNSTRSYSKKESEIKKEQYIEILKTIDQSHFTESYDSIISRLLEKKESATRNTEIEAVNRFYFGKNTGNKSEFYLGLKGVVSEILKYLGKEEVSKNFGQESIQNFDNILYKKQTVFVDEDKNIIIKE